MVAANAPANKGTVRIDIDRDEHQHFPPGVIDAILADPKGGFYAPADWNRGEMWSVELLVEVKAGLNARFRAFVLTDSLLHYPHPSDVAADAGFADAGTLIGLLAMAAVKRPVIDSRVICCQQVLDFRTAA